MGSIWAPLAKAIAAAGAHQHVDCLIDLIGADIAHDLVTVTRYSATQTPEFIKQAKQCMDDEARQQFIDFIAENPLSGDIIPGTGRARKIRWQSDS